MRVFGLTERRYSQAISLAAVARALRLTPGHLTTVVLQRTGRTVLERTTERRMTEVRRLLGETDLPISEVGRRVRYIDPAYFTRSFRRATQVTPSGATIGAALIGSVRATGFAAWCSSRHCDAGHRLASRQDPPGPSQDHPLILVSAVK